MAPEIILITENPQCLNQWKPPKPSPRPMRKYNGFVTCGKKSWYKPGERSVLTINYARSQGTSRPSSPIPQTSTPPTFAFSAVAQVCECVRKWGIKFDGKTDPISFLERVEHQKINYGIPGDLLLQALPELLKDNAFSWYRNNRPQWNHWDDFITQYRQRFLGPRYRFRLEEEIRDRRQKDGEKAGDYIDALQTLMTRHGEMSPEKQLERLYENLSELQQLAQDFEDITKPRSRNTPAPNIPVHAVQTSPLADSTRPPYNPTEVCWRCGQRGHFKTQCRGKFKLFCSRCGKDGVYSRDCRCPRPGNEPGRLA